jgi:hypothetical protein
MHVEVDGNRVSITDIVVDAEGRSERRVNTFEADGVEHPSVNGYSLTVSWRGSRAIETLGRKDGDVIGHGTYEVSPDGMTMTIEGEHQRIVLERLLTSG